MLNEEILPTLILFFPDQFDYGYFRKLWWIQDDAPAQNVKKTAAATEISLLYLMLQLQLI